MNAATTPATTTAPALKPGHLTTEFWLTIVSNLAPLLMAIAGVLPDRWAAAILVAANGLYALSRGMAKKAVTTTAIATSCLLAAFTFGLTSCATTGITTDEVTSVTSVAVSNGLQFGIKDPAQRSAVAAQMTQVATIYTTYSNGKIPTPEQFQALLNQYLPAGETKAITVSNLTALYTLRYSSFANYQLPEQLVYLTSFLQGVKLGAAPFVALP